MKKRLIWGFFILFSIATFAQTPQKKGSMNKYEQQWVQIESFEKQDLPQSASKVVDEILQKAIAEKNTSQVIKALIYKNKYIIAVDNTQNTQIFSDLGNLIETANVVDQSILHSMLAELYLNYLENNSWKIGQRTNITGFVPEDIQEWSRNIFHDKVFYHLSKSVEKDTYLTAESTKSYEAIIELGDDSQRLRPTLYCFLLNRAIDLSSRITSEQERNTSFLKSLQAKNIKIKDLAIQTSDFLKFDFSGDDNLSTLNYFRKLLQIQGSGINEALMLTEIKKNQYLSNRSETYRTKYSDDFLFALYKKNEAHDFSVEVIDAITNSQQYSIHTYHYRGENTDNNENQAKIYELLKSGITKYPNYRRVEILKQKLSEIERPHAELTGQAIYHPENKSKKFTLNYKNLKSAIIKVADKKTGTILDTKKITLSQKNTYTYQNEEFFLELDKVGEYKITAEYDGQQSTNTPINLTISRLANFARTSGEEEYEFYIVDRLTSTPIADATINIYSTDWDNKNTVKLSSVKTDSRGLAIFNSKNIFTQINKKRYIYRVSKGNDALSENNDFPYYYSYNSSPSYGNDYISIMTDRSIYRPGQTVHFKIISNQQVDKNTTRLNTNKDYKVSLYNANNQLVSEQSMQTNEFGSIAGQFVLPQGGLTGQYRIEVANNSQYFTVEEYKRPTFQITFDKLDKTYTFGDEVKIIGHAENFSGIKLQGATVEYNIEKSSLMRWWMPSTSETVDNAIITTKDDGSFEIVFTIPQNDSRKSWFNSIFNFNIEASITDSNGETQRGNYNFAVGDVSMILSVNIPAQIDKESKEKIVVKATNLNGDSISANGTYTVYSVLPNDSIKDKITSGNFSSDSEINLMSKIKKLPSAKYLLSLDTKDDKNRDVTSRNYFVLYSENDKNPPIETNEWLIEKQTIFSPTKNAEIIFGVSAKEATILYDIMKGNKILERQQFNLSNTNKKLTIPYKDEYDDNVTVALTYVLDEKAYTQQLSLTKEQTDKNLKLKFEVFRDKLRPGQQEEWRISIKDNQDKPALAELLASMYDSSLDKLHPVSPWNISRFVKPYIYSSNFTTNSFRNIDETWSASYNYKDIPSYKWDVLKWFGLNMYNNDILYSTPHASSNIRIRGTAIMSKQSAPVMAENVVMQESADLGFINSKRNTPEDETWFTSYQEETGKGQTPQIRSNFSETAFFYPQLRTNEKGETIISFTIPESNTTWKFRALAYDKELNVGTLEAVATSRKELMVTPNLPRFIRHGDKTGISTKISNLSGNAINGKVRIDFFDPLTDQIKDINVTDKYQDFNLDKNASSSATWLFDIPSDIDMLGVRIIAESESFSDGEQHVLSVLPNRMLVTESMPMNVNGSQTKDFVFDKLVNHKSNTSSDYRLTLEYAGNPAWYAVQALPTLSNPSNENAVNWFASYYVNTLGSAITRRYPKVTNMIKAWKQQGGDKETLLSKLQKNEELKAVLLEETPWVFDAKDETDQMNQLSMLFDLNNTKIQTEEAIRKLKELQNPEGGWSWYKGMYSNRSVTQYILYGFYQLIKLGAVEYPSEVKEIQIIALRYLDGKIKEDFANLKKNNKDWQKLSSIATTQLEYMYVRSSYRDIPIDQPAREAERFYTSVAEKNWASLSLYERSLLTVLCKRNGNKELAEQIMKSIREHATTNEEMGMFWANNTSHVFMSQSAISVHTFIMDAFRETKAPANEMDMMKQWLLKQKQTQVWESTHGTTDAIYALLSTGSDWLASSGESKITIGQKSVEPENKEAGTGYFKETWSKNEIKPEMGKVRIEKTDNGPAWGALYWQYYEDLDKITGQSGELNVDKKIFVEKSTTTGKTLVEVTENNPLTVGDKAVIRLTVRVDRDMEFVHLKDMRASCFEPVETISGLKWQNMTYYYQSTKDASTNFFFDNLRKGTYVFEYPVYVNRKGEYSNGITSIQCMYAPEFISHTAGKKMIVK